jgi:hypothetical protein
MLGVIDPSPQLLAELRPALASQIGDRAADAVPDVVLLEMTLPASRRKRREQWLRHLPAGSIEWPSVYRDCYARYAQGRRLRLSEHEILIDTLVDRVIKLAYVRYNASRHALPKITPHVVFRTLEGTTRCVERDGLHWPIASRAEAWKILLECPYPDCACWVYQTNDKGLEQMQRIGIALRPGAVGN